MSGIRLSSYFEVWWAWSQSHCIGAMRPFGCPPSIGLFLCCWFLASSAPPGERETRTNTTEPARRNAPTAATYDAHTIGIWFGVIRGPLYLGCIAFGPGRELGFTSTGWCLGISSFAHFLHLRERLPVILFADDNFYLNFRVIIAWLIH